jgi:hypothetical protein
MSCLEIYAVWLTAFGTLALAVAAIFQDSIRGLFYRPRFQVSVKTEPPDCVSVPFTKQDGTFIADVIYLRLWIMNMGNATAKNAEVYAQDLRRERADGCWERVGMFPPMNLKWANLGHIYFPTIAPGMGKYCDIGHIVDPTCRATVGEDSPNLALSNHQTSLAFDLMVSPNHRGHIIGPGKYQLNILVAAENAPPIKKIITINLSGTWDADEIKMLRDGIGVNVQ